MKGCRKPGSVARLTSWLVHAQRQLCPTPQAAQVALHNTVCLRCNMINNKLEPQVGNSCMCRHALGRFTCIALGNVQKAGKLG